MYMQGGAGEIASRLSLQVEFTSCGRLLQETQMNGYKRSMTQYLSILVTNDYKLCKQSVK